jgi:hypothetical protein
MEAAGKTELKSGLAPDYGIDEEVEHFLTSS